MSNRIIRFGGSSVGNIKSIQNLQNIIISGNYQRTFVVVSAILKLLHLIEDSITRIFNSDFDLDKLDIEIHNLYLNSINADPSERFSELKNQLISLLNGISLIGDYSLALRDQVISYSEKLTVEILLSQWEKTGREASVVFPEKLGLRTTSDFGNATFVSVDTEKIAQLKSKVLLVPGSYGIDKFGKIVRAGKTAADYTASALTAFLAAGKLELWGLDNSFRKADPVLVENPPIIPRLTYSEAGELAYFDHYSFHPRTVELLEPKHIPIHVLNPESQDVEVETTINTETFIDDKIVKSVACSDDISLLKLEGPGVGLKPGILAKVTSALHETGINIKSVITSQTSINLILGKESGDKSLALIKKLGFSSVQHISLQKDVSLIGIIGHGMQQNYGISALIFNAVAQNKINVVLSGSGASELVSYLIVNDADKKKSVRVIYDAFFSEANDLSF